MPLCSRIVVSALLPRPGIVPSPLKFPVVAFGAFGAFGAFEAFGAFGAFGAFWAVEPFGPFNEAAPLGTLVFSLPFCCLALLLPPALKFKGGSCGLPRLGSGAVPNDCDCCGGNGGLG